MNRKNDSKRKSINFRQVMGEGDTIFCNLACNKLLQEEQRMLGAVILHKIVQAGESRADTSED